MTPGKTKLNDVVGTICLGCIYYYFLFHNLDFSQINYVFLQTYHQYNGTYFVYVLTRYINQFCMSK